MALTLELTNGADTLDLMGATYHLVRGTLDLGNPSRITAESANLYRGWDLVAHGFTKRTIAMQLNVTASGLTGLGTAFSELEETLRLARDYQLHGIGSRWQLKVNIGAGTTDVYFNIQNGQFTPSPGGLRSQHLTTSRPYILSAPLVLECDPIGEGAEETIYNYGRDPSFEVAGTPLADWPLSLAANHTRTITRVTTQHHYGLASLEVDITASIGGGESFARQDYAALPGEVWSVGTKVHVTSIGTNGTARLAVEWLNVAMARIAVTWIDRTTTTGDFIDFDMINQTAPALTAWLRIWVAGHTAGAGDTVTCYYDGIHVVKAATLPTAWISGESIVNHFDDDGQAHLNYVDIHDVPGDYPAKVQLKAAEAQAHTKMWLGARIRDRQYDVGIWHEGEDFDKWTSEPADANASAGNYGRYTHDKLVLTQVASGQNSAVNNLVVNINPAGTDQILIVGVSSFEIPAGAAPTGVTFGGVSLTKITEITNNQTNASLWYLLNPAEGAANVVITFAAVMNWIGAGCLVYGGVCQKAPFRSSATNTGNSVTPNVTVESEVDDVCVDAVMFKGPVGGVTGGVGQVLKWDVTDFANYRGSGSDMPASAGATTTLTWTFGVAAQDWASVGVSLIPAATPICSHIGELTVATPPVGDYQVLARVRGLLLSDFEIAMGYEYGGVTYDPSLPGHYVSVPADNIWRILNIGSLAIPPSDVPDGATIGTATLRLAIYHVTHGTGRTVEVDWVMLMPVDFGDAYSSKDAATEVMVSDTISRTPEVTRWSAADVFLGRPVQEGRPPFVDPDGFRVYYVWDNGTDAAITDGADVEARIRSQWMVLA